MQIGDVVELIEDTIFYKKGQKAVVMSTSSYGNDKKMEVRYDGEDYLGNDVDVVPKAMFKVVG